MQQTFWSMRFPTYCKGAHLSYAYKFYHYHQCYHKLRVKIFNLNISPAYQYQIQGGGSFLQSPRVKTHQSAPIPSSIKQFSTSPSLDPHTNPWIKTFTKKFKTPQIPKASKTQAAPRQVHHRLRRSLCNFRKKFRIRAAQNLVSNHLFKLKHHFHIYNEQGKNETIDTLLIRDDSDNWWKYVEN